MVPQRRPHPKPGTCGYNRSGGKRGIKVASGNKIINQLTLKQGDCLDYPII